MRDKALNIDEICFKGIDPYREKYSCAPDLDKRIAEQRYRVQRILSSGVERWGAVNEGLMSTPIAPPNTLEGPELIIENKLKDQLLKARKKLTQKKPIIAVDFGGMISYSFLKVATHLRDFIERGELVMVSTSLAFDPENPEQHTRLGSEQTYQWFFDFFKENRHLMHFIQTNAFGFKNVQLEAVDGTAICLGDGVDWLQEFWSISVNSLLLDLEYPALGECLNPGGEMVLDHCVCKNRPEWRQGIDNLRKIGVHPDETPWSNLHRSYKRSKQTDAPLSARFP